MLALHSIRVWLHSGGPCNHHHGLTFSIDHIKSKFSKELPCKYFPPVAHLHVFAFGSVISPFHFSLFTFSFDMTLAQLMPDDIA